MSRNEVEVVETTRQRLGPVGVWLAAAQAAIDRERQAARRIEELGYGSIRTPEGLAGKEAFAHQSLLLAATERIVTGTQEAGGPVCLTHHFISSGAVRPPTS
jgi:hypothetical protein